MQAERAFYAGGSREEYVDMLAARVAALINHDGEGQVPCP